MHVSSLVRWFSLSFTQLHHHRRKSLLPTNSTTKHLYTYNTSFWSKLRALSMRPCAILPRNSRHKSLPKSLNKLSTFVDGYSSRKTLRVSQIVCLVFGCWIGGALCWRFSWLFAFVCLNVGNDAELTIPKENPLFRTDDDRKSSAYLKARAHTHRHHDNVWCQNIIKICRLVWAHHMYHV